MFSLFQTGSLDIPMLPSGVLIPDKLLINMSSIVPNVNRAPALVFLSLKS